MSLCTQKEVHVKRPKSLPLPCCMTSALSNPPPKAAPPHQYTQQPDQHSVTHSDTCLPVDAELFNKECMSQDAHFLFTAHKLVRQCICRQWAQALAVPRGTAPPTSVTVLPSLCVSHSPWTHWREAPWQRRPTRE